MSEAHSQPSIPPPTLRLRVTSAAETIVRGGHPWVFAASVREQNRPGVAGELAVAYDRQNRFLALGLYDPASPIRLRVLLTGKPQTIDRAWWAVRLDQAVQRREGIFTADTTGYRLINGESDGWPGLVLDRYAGTLVLKIYTAAWQPRLEEIVGLIQTRLNPEHIVLRTSRNLQEGTTQALSLGNDDVVFSKRDEWKGDAPVIFQENGLRFAADVVRGQKTGFFLDQRENRQLVGTLARGRRVLNAFSFSGGFSLYAARGGATAVTDLDLSRHALAAAKANFALNYTEAGIARCRHETIAADAFAWLAENTTRPFDLIILDPPSLAKRESERAGAIRAYGKLATDALRQLTPGGALVACSCSAHVTAVEFFGAVRQAARNRRRRFTEWQTTGHAPDHPASFPEAHYLKAIYLRC